MRTAETKGILSTQEKEDSNISGTVAGGRKAAKTNMLRHGEDFYRVLGARGGRNGKGPGYKGGFASNPELARRAGAKGGRKSKRGAAKGNPLNDDAEKIMRLVKNGASYVDIAKLYGVPYHAVTYWMRKKNNA